MTDNRVMVGASGVNKAFIFRNTEGTWGTTAAFALDQNTDGYFGSSGAMTDNWVMVGANNVNKAFVFRVVENSCPTHSSKLSANGSDCVTCESGKYAWFGYHRKCIDCENALKLITMNQGGVYRNSVSSRARFLEAFAKDGACDCAKSWVANNVTALKKAYNKLKQC
jgi:hypothetical protein